MIYNLTKGDDRMERSTRKIPVEVTEKVLMELYKKRLTEKHGKVISLTEDIVKHVEKNYNGKEDIRDIITATCLASLFLTDAIIEQALDEAPENIKKTFEEIVKQED